jgi:hypothetical protein
MMRRFAALLTLSLCLPFPAQAQQGLRYAVDERFAVINEDAYGDLNVSIQQVSFEALPAFIQAQLANMAYKCTGNNENAYRIKVYSYTSESTRRQRLPANYMLDMQPLAAQPLSACSYPPLCANGMCNLVGFKAIEKDTWTRAFNLPVLNWEFKQRPYPGTSLPQTYLQTKTFDPECARNGGTQIGQNEQCRYEYVWTGDGLSMLPKPQTGASE